MADTFKLLPNKEDSNNINEIGASSAYFDNAYITNLHTVTLNTTGNTSTADTIIELNNGVSGANGNDIGIAFDRGSSTNAAFMWDEHSTPPRFTLVEQNIDASTSGDFSLDAGTLATLRAKIAATSLIVEGGTGVTGTANASITLPAGSINIRALDFLNAGDGSSNISSTDLFIMHDIDASAGDSPRSVTASALKTYIAATGEALDLTNSGLSAIDAIASTDRFIIADASSTFGNKKVDFSVLQTAVLTGNAGTATVLATARTIGGVSFNGSANIDLPGVNSAGDQNTTGSAATLTTARTIGGVSFDGSANIDLPGVNSAGNQNTTGSAATLTTARTLGGVSFDGSANIDLPGVNSAGDQDTSGNAGTATALATARTIGGVSFDGSANIDLPGVNSAGNQNTTGSAATLTTARTIGGVSFNGSANIDLPGVNSAGNQNTTGSAATLTTARTIGGVSFDGSANIDLPGVNAEGDQNTTGNAGTATVLATARTIGGVSFDGSANIDLPGVNSAGNQNTTGSAATLTTARTLGGVSFNGSANIDLPGVNAAGNQDTSGNAGTATLAAEATILATARNIGGVSFDGSANIDLPGVNSAGNQNTTGSAATLTTARNIGGVSFDGSANIDLPGVNSAGNQDTSGNAGTATVLATARDIGGVSFDGSANIDLPGVNTAGNQNTTGSAATLTTARTIGGVSFNGSANINLPGVNSAGNQNTTGSAATLTTARNIGGVSFDGSANIDLPGVNSSGNQDTSGTAALATQVTITQNDSTNETVYLAFVDGVSGSQGLEVDSGLAYNPSTGVLTATISGNITTATEATNVTVSANNSANETVYLTFVDGGSGGTEGIETDTGLTYNPSTGVLTTSSVTGDLTGDVTGAVTGNADTATEATNVTVTANNSTAEDVYLTFVDGATGTQGLETDTALSYNPSTDTLTVGTVAGSTLTTPKIVNDGYIADANGNELVQFVTTASAVNHIKVTNAATGSGAQIETVGGDTNIDLNLVAKGDGVVKVSDKLRVTGQSNFNSQLTVGASGSEANLYVYGELHVDNGVAVFDTASFSLQDPLLFMAKDGAGTADIGFFGKTASITNGNADKDSDVACHTGIFFDSDQRNTGNGLYRFFRAPTGNVSADNVVTVNKSQNFVNPAIEACNIKADIETVSSAPTLDLGNRFVLVNGNYNTTLPTPSATYEGVEFVIRMISNHTPNLVPGASGQLIDSSGTAQNIAFAAHGTLRVVCGKDSSSAYKWYQV